MTTPTISPTLTLAALPLGAMPALAMPPSGELTIPPDFALTLAELAAIPADGIPRPKLADPGNALPVEFADPLTPLAGATLEEVLPVVPEGRDPHPAAAAEKTAEDDATLDPALSWLIAPPPAVPMPVQVAATPITVPVRTVSPQPVETPGATAKPLAGPPTPVEAIAAPVAVDTAVAPDPTAPPATTQHTARTAGLDTKPQPQPPVASPASVSADDVRVSLPVPTPAPATRKTAITEPSPSAAAPETPAMSAALPRPRATTARPLPDLDAKLAKVIARAPVVTVATGVPAVTIEQPLPVAPPRFVQTRVTPTVVASAVVALPVVTVTIPAPVAPPPAEAVAPADPLPQIPAPAPEKTAPQLRDGAQAPVTAAAPAQQPAAPVQPATPSIAALGAAVARPLPRPIELRPLGENTASLFAAALTQAVTAPTTVQPAIDAKPAGMDLTRDTGLERMIDRIEMLRDDADARDTRIRLIPDALGPVEVSVRRDGDAVRVHFIAEQPATRALIADAQPRLSELAEARGVRISQASVDTGTGAGTAGDGRARPQPQPETRMASAPRGARNETDDSGDDRIA